MWKRIWNNQVELTPLGRQLVWGLVGLYLLMLIWICWTPQPPSVNGVETPNIMYWGNLVFLPVPFNSLLFFGELDGAKEIIWVVGQNVVNIFLLFPLILGILALFPHLRKIKRILLLSFIISMTIECGQLLLDWLIQANRVFEIDDLWTNTLGGGIALWTFNRLQKLLKSLI